MSRSRSEWSPHTLIIVGAVVAIVAVVIETVRHSAARRAAV